MIALRRRVEELTGWRRRAGAFVLGALAVLALPPFHVVPVLAVSFTGLAWLALGSGGIRAAFAAGWWFGAGFFAAGLYWLANALLVDAARFGWMVPFAIGGLAAGLGLFPAAACALARLGAGRAAGAISRVLWLALAFVALEWLRGVVLTGFPWNLIGTVWTFSSVMIQPAAWTGVHGLSLATVALAALPAALGWRESRAAHARIVVAGVVLGGLAVWFAAGLARVTALGPEAAGDVAGVRLRLVQPAIPQNLKWSPDARAGHVVKQVEMSRTPSPSPPSPTHVIWAETAVPFYLERDANLRAFIATAVPAGGALITGAPRASEPGADPFRVWNSLHVLNPSGAIVATYDKAHLVPFGEYVPLRAWVPGWIAKITHGEVDFSSGPGPVALPIPGAPPASPLICYEAIFEGRVVPKGERPGWLLNLTNDAWYGMSPGPYQHFAQARLRAVEEGLPLVRVANNGISAIVDSLGRVRATLALGREGVVDGPLPVALAPTLFSFSGTWSTPFALVMFVVVLSFARFGRKRRIML
ncbi:MAG: apolipoprotein N-acyltransferase [Rhodospirillales bacterium]|nr:apolipoprotein N-acyltransferase [Rhodospirillales bacterium]MSP80701.1 apolipoprotein N-acyltransferase [Rhodospirillales bacterium]